MQNLNIAIDFFENKPIKKKSDEKLYQEKELQSNKYQRSAFSIAFPIGESFGGFLRGRSSISNLKNDQFLSLPSMKNSNVEVYYGNAPLGVPFKWEIQPGTPKVKILETPLPPLTPPPSYLDKKKKKNDTKKQTKGKLLQRKNQLQSSPTSSSSSSSLSSLSFSSPPRCWSYSMPASPCRIRSNF
ncbi:unnamed protein product [Withania somnifera]